MDNIDIRLLRAFLVLMNERNVSHAAERLEVSQPAASHSLARLRRVFNDPLLLKSKSGMLITPRGEEIAATVSRWVSEYDALVQVTDEFDSKTSRRTFVITATEHAEHLVMPALLRDIRKRAPSVRLRVRLPEPDRSLELLESGEVDLRFAWLIKPPLSMRSAPLFQDRFVCIAARDHPEIRGSLTVAQFLRFPHARTYGTNRTTSNRVIDEAIQRLGRESAPPFQLQNFLSVPLALGGTDLIATVPLSFARMFAKQYPLQVVEPPIRLPRIRYAAYWHERNQKEPGHRWLRDMVSAVAKTLRA
jgi:DNA-binding transcriptional LysR family regulator